jgi:hypothetical protein
MSDNTTSPLTTVTNSSTTLPLDAPRVSLTDKSVEEMNDEELREFVRFVRDRRTSQQLANENKPSRAGKGSGELPETKKKKLLNDLLAGNEEESEEV